MRSPSTRIAAATVLVSLLIAACSSTGSSAAPSATSAASTSGAAAAGITVSDAWVRPPMGTDLPAAGYLTITSAGAADALVGATSPVADEVQIHETMAGASGMTGMQPVSQIDVPAGGSVKLQPGGYHLMLMGVKDLPAVGSTVELTLTFRDAGEVKVQAEVRAG